MPLKIVRFARVLGHGYPNHYAGYYPLPSILQGDDVVFWSKTLEVVLHFRPGGGGLFAGDPADIPVEPTAAPDLTKGWRALREINLATEFRTSNITVEVGEVVDQSGEKRHTPIRLNFRTLSYIDVCDE